MNDLTFSSEEVNLLNELTNLNAVEIVWDINAFYFNSATDTYKLECISQKPAGSDYIYDEIFSCRFSKLNERISFEDNSPEFWYKIISKGCKIIEIQYINVVEQFPENQVVMTTQIDNKLGLNKSTLGLIIQTDKGYIPAFILPSNHGFTWHEKYEYYSKNEIANLLQQNIKHYELKNC